MSVATTSESKAVEMVPTLAERSFALVQREATAMANSSLVPKEFQGNVANCLIALNLARRIGADPLMVVQNLDVIHGRPSFRATFLIACLNQCGRFTPLRYRITGEGKDRTCVAIANDMKTGEEYEGPPVSIQMAHDEGWATKSGSKWKTMPDLMLRYRAAAFFARTTAPEVAMGLYTSDELEEIHHAPTGQTARSATEAIERARDITPPKAEDESQAPEVDAVDAAFGLSGDEPDDF